MIVFDSRIVSYGSLIVKLVVIPRIDDNISNTPKSYKAMLLWLHYLTLAFPFLIEEFPLL